jgi:hypothetical protein
MFSIYCSVVQLFLYPSVEEHLVFLCVICIILIPIYQSTWHHIPEHCNLNIIFETKIFLGIAYWFKPQNMQFMFIANLHAAGSSQKLSSSLEILLN